MFDPRQARASCASAARRSARRGAPLVAGASRSGMDASRGQSALRRPCRALGGAARGDRVRQAAARPRRDHPLVDDAAASASASSSATCRASANALADTRRRSLAVALAELDAPRRAGVGATALEARDQRARERGEPARVAAARSACAGWPTSSGSARAVDDVAGRRDAGRDEARDCALALQNMQLDSCACAPARRRTSTSRRSRTRRWRSPRTWTARCTSPTRWRASRSGRAPRGRRARRARRG